MCYSCNNLTLLLRNINILFCEPAGLFRMISFAHSVCTVGTFKARFNENMFKKKKKKAFWSCKFYLEAQMTKWPPPPWQSIHRQLGIKRPATACGESSDVDLAVWLKINGCIMFYKQAKSGVGQIIGQRAGQLTLSRESRNKPEEKGSLETHSTIAERNGGWVQPYRWANGSGCSLLNHSSTVILLSKRFWWERGGCKFSLLLLSASLPVLPPIFVFSLPVISWFLFIIWFLSSLLLPVALTCCSLPRQGTPSFLCSSVHLYDCAQLGSVKLSLQKELKSSFFIAKT